MADDPLPLIDLTALRTDDPSTGAARVEVAARIDDACRRHGFFRITGHGVPADLGRQLERTARTFFERTDDEKSEIAMGRGGAAWRGWFGVGGELTSGRPDQKEGIYFGTELPADHPAVVAGRPLHGSNLFPAEPADLRPAVLGWMTAMTELGRVLLEGIAIGLGLDARWFEHHVTAEPTVLFRIFHYPPGDRLGSGWGVGEHTDYGLLTILAQDDQPGLQVHGPGGWIDVPAERDVFVVNLGDMLERMTGGRYRSTPHRVCNTTGTGRLSFPCFIDPSWDARCAPMPLAGPDRRHDGGSGRWDGADVHAWDGRYGDYLTAKVARVFPELFASSVSPHLADDDVCGDTDGLTRGARQS